MELQEAFIIVASCLGFVCVCNALFSFARWVWVMFLRPSKNLKEYGSWVVITGPTYGIGKALAFELASKGLNIVLVGQNPSKLEATSDEIRRKYSHEQVETKSIVVDLAKTTGEELARTIDEGIKGLDVGILINNAGIAYPYARYFHEVDSELMENVLKVNLDAPSWVTKAVLPGMLRKKKGAIVNIGSASSEYPSLPLYTLYAATKTYLRTFSKCLHLEYKQHGIDFQCQVPSFVATEMTKDYNKLNFMIMATVETFGKASIRWIGYEHLCNPYWLHSVHAFIVHAIPDALFNAIMFRAASKIRKEARTNEGVTVKNAVIT